MANSVLKSDDHPTATRELQLMFAGSQCIALFADDIEVIADWRTPAQLPDAPPSVLGVVSLRGRMLTVLDAALLLGEGAATAKRKIVGLPGDEQIALAVDNIGEVIQVTPDEINAASEAATTKPLIVAIVSKAGQSIAVLDHKQLFATAMRGRERRRRHF